MRILINKSNLITVLLCSIIIFLMSAGSEYAVSSDDVLQKAELLNKLGILNEILTEEMLDTEVNRADLAIISLKILGKNSDTDVSDWDNPFADVHPLRHYQKNNWSI